MSASYRPIFATSTARAGSYLVSMLLSTNRNVTIASEPYLELFRSLRNAIVREDASPELRGAFDPASPMQDYYFSRERIGVMDVVQLGELSVRFDPGERDRFLRISAERLKLQCAELVPYVPEIRGDTYREMFDNALAIIAKARGAEDLRWIGIKDAWTIELFAPLARAYPDARFVAILRDPRATIHSMLRADPATVANVLSYARHWRKLVAFILHYRQSPLFAGRLHVVRHEDLLRKPEGTARRLCAFLEVEFDPRMLDTNNYLDYATGEVWRGNSSMEETARGIEPVRAERWRSGLEAAAVQAIDFVCAPDMLLAGYEPLRYASEEWPEPSVLGYLMRSNGAYAKWRSDFGDPQLDFGCELFRRALLAQMEPPVDEDLVRRSFLFPEVYDALRKARGTAAEEPAGLLGG